MEKELLAPAGSMQALRLAIMNGANAIYVGGKRFGARAYAPNFSEEELIEAANLCHLYGVRLYVTINTMCYESELKAVLEYATFLYQNHIDAVIVSDLGLIHLLRENLPDLEIHVSTQAHTFSKEQIEYYHQIGVKRVVVDRELSLEEIEDLPDLLEIEVFIHGALCVCYSGECLFSALTSGRSGNRGTCAQYCRMPYEIYYENKPVNNKEKYVLSTKELNTSHYMDKLMQSKIKSFKIEGRMKSPEYVGFITKYYRDLIDEYQKNKEAHVNEEQEQNLKTIFNREFTSGYLFQEQNIMNMQTPNHIGIEIGKVIEVTKDKIKILLNKRLNQEDGIRFEGSGKGMIVNYLYHQNGKLISHANPNEIVYLDNKIGLTKKEVVRKTLDKKLMDSLKNVSEKKIGIDIEIEARLESFTLRLICENDVVEVQKDICERAKTIGMTKENITEKITRLGDTPFVVKNIHISLEDNLFIPVSKLNEIRREAIEQLIEKRVSR